MTTTSIYKSGDRIELYWDTQDPSNYGWAWRWGRVDGREESGPLDGDLDEDDDPRQQWYEQEVRYGGAPTVAWQRDPEGAWIGTVQ